MSGMPPDENPEPNHGSRSPLHELAEALTAIQNFASAAQHLARKQHAEAPPELDAALDHLTKQVQRAVIVLRRLQADAGERAKGSG